MKRVRPYRISRRAMLRGGAVAIGLPYLEAMMTSSALASPKPTAPPRMAMFYFGTGMNTRQYFPNDYGPKFKTTRILKPLDKAKLRGEFTVLSGTYLKNGGGHDGAYAFSTSIAKGEKQIASPDQIAAKQLGVDTRFASLQMSVDRGTNYGSQALATISWNEQGVPLAAENDPKVLFQQLFSPDTKEQKGKEKDLFRRRGSILDVVNSDAKRMKQSLGKMDREQLEQYFNSIRELEKSLERKIDWADKPKPEPKLLDDLHYDYGKSMTPEGSGDFLYRDYGRMMYDLIAMAFQTDSTRAISYVVRKELAGGVFPEFNVSKGYHSLSHHGNDPQNLEELARVDEIYMEQWAYLLNRLRSIKEGEQTLLDRTVLGFSSGMGMGHSKNRLPTMISGGKALGIKHQGHVDVKEMPLSSLWETMLQSCGVNVEGEFQDSKGPIKALLS